MVFNSLIRFAKYSTKFSYNKPFFQSNTKHVHKSLSIISHEGTKKHHFKNKSTTNDHSNGFLGISDGHYGVYYSMYNRDSERRRLQQEHENYIKHYILKHLESNDRFKVCKFRHHKRKRQRYRNRRRNLHFKFFSISAKLLISKAVFDSFVNFDNIKRSSKKIVTALYYKPHFNLIFNNPTPFNQTQVQSNVFSQVFSMSKRNFTTSTKANDTQKTSTMEVKEIDFEDSFVDCQVDNIIKAYNSKDYNSILPYYQAIKRNDLKLPTIELYNMVLESIIHRSLDSELDIDALENKLTNLLTIYQDILKDIKPNAGTFDLVINELLDSTLTCTTISASNHMEFEIITNKAKEFVQISLELFNSIPNLNLKFILPKLLLVLNKYPELLSADLLHTLIPLMDSQIEDKQFLLSAIELSKYFTQFNVMDHKQSYNTIDKLYKQFVKLSDCSKDEIKVYGSVLESLMLNNHSAKAGQLLDNILIDYKSSKHYTEEQVGQLLGIFLKSYSFKFGITKSYQLLTKFQSVSFIPEVPALISNYFICKLAECGMYAESWKLYNRIAITKQFNDLPSMEFIKADGICSRDVLLSLSIATQDDERVFQMIKELLMMEFLVAPSVLAQLLQYCSVNNHIDVMMNIAESQVKYYKKTNDYLSLIIDYLFAVPTEKLMNSNLIRKCYESFSLQNDNIYGLYKAFELHKTTTGNFDFHSYVINQFEDVDNYYVDLPDEVRHFKMQLIEQFKNNINDIHLTPNMLETCKHLDLQPIKMEVTSTSNDLNLSIIFQINQKLGVQRFLQLYSKGNSFDINTWEMVINKKLFDSYKINMMKLLQRLWMTNCEKSDKIQMINKLISFKKDKILGYIIQFFLRNKIFDTELWNNLLRTCNEISVSKRSTLRNILTNDKVNNQIKHNLKVCSDEYAKFFMRYGKGTAMGYRF